MIWIVLSFMVGGVVGGGLMFLLIAESLSRRKPR
jgi:hypothetical protein